MILITFHSQFRFAAFGFLGGKEVQDAGIGHLGLQDRTLGLVPRLVHLRY